MPNFSHDNLEFHYLDRGQGLPVVFQHGLGSDTERVFAQVEVPAGFRLLGLDCRGHGKTTPLGAVDKLRFDAFSDDLAVWLEHLRMPSVVIGGTSMGAGVALNFALRHPEQVLGLVLLRPAWLDGPNAANARVFAAIAQLIRQHGPSAGQALFRETDLFATVARESCDSAESLLGLFSDPRAYETVARLERIPQDAPNHDRAEWRRITVPTLVLANRQDPIHPFEYGQALAQTIPGARFEELVSKSQSLSQYLAGLRAALADFLQRTFKDTTVNPKNLC